MSPRRKRTLRLKDRAREWLRREGLYPTDREATEVEQQRMHRLAEQFIAVELVAQQYSRREARAEPDRQPRHIDPRPAALRKGVFDRGH
jgi:hypothetical protein